MDLFADTELLSARLRLQAGAIYNGRGTSMLGYLNAPADGQDLIARGQRFFNNPILTAVGSAATVGTTIYPGYPSGVMNVSRNGQFDYPTQHFNDAKSAALLYAIDPTTYLAYGQKVITALLAQVDEANKGTAQSRTIRLSNWDNPITQGTGGIAAEEKAKNPSYRLPLDAGVQEAALISRQMVGYICVKSLCTLAERTKIEDFLWDQVNWLYTREVFFPLSITAMYPRWLDGNFSEKKYLAQTPVPNYVGEPWNKANANNPREVIWANAGDTGGYLYTHRKPDGTLGYRIAKAHYMLNNQNSIRMTAVCLGGLAFTDSTRRNTCINAGKRYAQTYVVNSTFPDGTTAEWLRNKDYNVNGEGAMAYNSHNIQMLLLATLVCELNGDNELKTWTTREGCWGTEVASNQPPKSLRLVADRHLEITTNTDVTKWAYAGAVTSANRITELADFTPPTRDRYLPHCRYLLILCNRFWPDAKFVNGFKGLIDGQPQVPTGLDGVTEITNNGPLASAWEGAYADLWPIHLFHADVTNEVLTGVSRVTVTGQGSVAVNTRGYELRANVTGFVNPKFSWKVPSTLAASGTNTARLVVSGKNGASIAVGTYEIFLAVTHNAGTSRQKVTITV